MNITSPADGAVLPLHQTIHFEGTAGPTAVRVRLTADGILIADAPVVGGAWSASRLFSTGGIRAIQLQGLDANGMVVATIGISINLVNGHQPPAGTEGHLSGIVAKISQGQRLTPGFVGLQYMAVLPGGALYFESDLDLDTDGWRTPGLHYEPTHLDQTSIDPTGSVVDANEVPYFVLPGGFGGSLGIHLGDVAAVLFGDKIAFAIFADTGPTHKIGEGSIALHRALGFERVRNSRIQDVGIDRDVVTIVFPHSGNGGYQSVAQVEAIGKAAFAALGGAV